MLGRLRRRFCLEILIDVPGDCLAAISAGVSLNTLRMCKQNCLLDLLRAQFNTFDALSEAFKFVSLEGFHPVPHAPQRTNNTFIPGSDGCRSFFDILTCQGNSARAKPSAKKQEIDVNAKRLLQCQTFFGDFGLPIDCKRELPKLIVVLQVTGVVGAGPITNYRLFHGSAVRVHPSSGGFYRHQCQKDRARARAYDPPFRRSTLVTHKMRERADR